jgi:hypothetical protein
MKEKPKDKVILSITLICNHTLHSSFMYVYHYLAVSIFKTLFPEMLKNFKFLFQRIMFLKEKY